MEITAPPDDAFVDLADVDLYGPSGFRTKDLHPTWRTLRVAAPVWWQDRGAETGFWCVTRYADCERVVKDYRTYSSEEGTILASVGVGDAAGGQTITLTMESWLSFMTQASNRTWLAQTEYDPDDLSAEASIAIFNGTKGNALVSSSPGVYVDGFGYIQIPNLP